VLWVQLWQLEDRIPECRAGTVNHRLLRRAGIGKTTMLSCCAAELDPALRVVVAEEVFEADIPLRQEGIVLKRRRALHAGCSHRRMAQRRTPGTQLVKARGTCRVAPPK